jgi:hypothetical protein
MSWNLRRDLHLDVSAQYGAVLLQSATDSSLRSSTVNFIAGDGMPIRLYFWERGAGGTITAADPGAEASIVFSGRPAGVPAGSDLLFLTTDFTQVSTGVWEGMLDLTTGEFAAHIAASPAGTKLILGEVEIRDSSSNNRRASFQFDIVARPQVYANQTPPAALPTPENWLNNLRPPSISRTEVPVNGVAYTTQIGAGAEGILYTGLRAGILVTHTDPVPGTTCTVTVVGDEITVTLAASQNMVCSGPVAGGTVSIPHVGTKNGKPAFSNTGEIYSTAATASDGLYAFSNGTLWCLYAVAGGMLVRSATAPLSGSYPSDSSWSDSNNVVTGATTAYQAQVAVFYSADVSELRVSATLTGSGLSPAYPGYGTINGSDGTAGQLYQTCVVGSVGAAKRVFLCTGLAPVEWTELATVTE